MKTSSRIQLMRSVVLGESGANVEVAKVLSLIWKDEIVDDYLKSHQIFLGEEEDVMSLICHGIVYFLEIEKRESGAEFLKWSCDTPKFFETHCLDIHCMDDWRYTKLEQMALGYLDEPYRESFLIDLECDDYTSDLMKWLSFNRHGFIQEAEFQSKIMSNGGTFFDVLQYAQTIELQEMGETFLRTLEQMAQSL